MRFGNFSVIVPEGTEQGALGHVGLPHGRQYTVRAMSHDHRRADAVVTIDGKDIGTFRLDGYGSLTLERAPNDHGRFTFYSDATAEADKAGIAIVPNADRGLIQVRFIPEKYRPPVPTMRWGGARGQSALEKTSGGITGLSGHSDQAFVSVGPIDYDESAAVVISLRLVAIPDGPRPLVGVLVGNAVPPPVS